MIFFLYPTIGQGSAKSEINGSIVLKEGHWGHIDQLISSKIAQQHHILIASDVDDVLLLKVSPSVIDSYERRGMTVRPFQKTQSNVAMIFQHWIASPNTTSFAITKRPYARASLTQRTLDCLSIPLSKPDFLKEYPEHADGIIYTSKQDKGPFLTDIMTKQNKFDMLVFVDDKLENCEEVARAFKTITDLKRDVMIIHYNRRLSSPTMKDMTTVILEESDDDLL